MAADATIVATCAALGIVIEKLVDTTDLTYTDYYCRGGAGSFRRSGQWVRTTATDSQATKVTAIQTALS